MGLHNHVACNASLMQAYNIKMVVCGVNTENIIANASMAIRCAWRILH
jgi:hypothetical protein